MQHIGSRVHEDQRSDTWRDLAGTCPKGSIVMQPYHIDDNSQPVAVNRNRLLVIDDEPSICEVISTIAAEAGYEVCATTSATDFKHYVASNDPTVIVLDVVMPDTDGIELMRYLAERNCKAPVLIMSGHRTYLGLSEALGRALGMPAVTAVPKPLEVGRVRSFLEEHLV